MAILNPKEVAQAPNGEATDHDESRQEVIAAALVSEAPSIPGIKAVRHITPLVMVALQRANNPYVTARRGFEAMGIDFDGEATKTDPAAFGIAMMPKTAEVLILLSCDKETLKKYAVGSTTLQSDAMDFMEDTTPEVLAEATVFVSEQLMSISKTRATKAPEERDSPEASTLNGASGKKKHVRTG